MKESVIENLILDYLSRIRGGFVMKIHVGGKPINTARGIKMVPFKNKHCPTGISDILFILSGVLYAIEIKTPEAHRALLRQYDRIRLESKLQLPEYLHHVKEQMDFIENVKRSGGSGGFASSLEQVKKIIDDKRKALHKLKNKA